MSILEGPEQARFVKVGDVVEIGDLWVTVASRRHTVDGYIILSDGNGTMIKVQASTVFTVRGALMAKPIRELRHIWDVSPNDVRTAMGGADIPVREFAEFWHSLTPRQKDEMKLEVLSAQG